MEILSLNQYSFQYALGKKPALKEISFSIEEGEFVLLCGLSGSGKTTLLKECKPTLASHGVRKGEIFFQGKSLKDLKRYEDVTGIGFVQQNPENQIVTDKVWHELAFGLESLGMDSQTIRLRVGEIASFFGMEEWFYKDVKDLSGGQMQMVNLASILAMQPKILLLDEPTSQLDPIAAAEFFQALKKINEELGITILLSEHRLGDVFSLVDRVLYMKEGKLDFQGSPRDFGERLAQNPEAILASAPIPTQIYSHFPQSDFCPLTVSEGVRWIEGFGDLEKDLEEDLGTEDFQGKEILSLRDLDFRYSKEGKDVLKNLNLSIKGQSITTILGGNGAGKTTALKLMAGLEKPFRGKVYEEGKPRSKGANLSIALVPQNPRVLFVKKTVGEELMELSEDKSLEEGHKFKEYCRLFRLEDLLESHPFDISGGEQQRLAVAKVMMADPSVLLLDEPTKGMDGDFKNTFGQMLLDLKARGTTVVIVSHDIEFCAQWADHCILFFHGQVISQGNVHSFFKGNHFYTTAANKMCRKYNRDIVNVDEAVNWLKGKGGVGFDRNNGKREEVN